MGEGRNVAVCGSWLARLVADGVDADEVVSQVRLLKPLVACFLGGRRSSFDLTPTA